MSRGGLFQISGGDRVVHHVFFRLPNLNSGRLKSSSDAPFPRGGRFVSRFREHLGAKAFAGLHHRPEDPGELVGQRHRH